MKKMLIMAMAVFALVACKKSNSADTGLPKAEEKALVATTSGAVDMMGESPAEVDKALTKAGYKKMNSSFNPFDLGVPARVIKKALTAEVASDEEVYYSYGLPENFESMSEKEIIAWANEVIESGDAVMLVTATFQSKQLNAMATVFIIKKSDKANKTFTGISDALYKKLPSAKTKHGWAGYIGDVEKMMEGNMSGAEQFTDHSKFVSKVAKVDGKAAAEGGAAMYEGWSYGNLWVNPDAEMEKEMLKAGLSAPICYGSYGILSSDYDSDF